ncbi:hypothetical protein CMPELA_07420 [Cupriavidus necator]|jgi:hypothetical protein
MRAEVPATVVCFLLNLLPFPLPHPTRNQTWTSYTFPASMAPACGNR